MHAMDYVTPMLNLSSKHCLKRYFHHNRLIHRSRIDLGCPNLRDVKANPLSKACELISRYAPFQHQLLVNIKFRLALVRPAVIFGMRMP
jgi:hypothetical protein